MKSAAHWLTWKQGLGPKSWVLDVLRYYIILIIYINNILIRSLWKRLNPDKWTWLTRLIGSDNPTNPKWINPLSKESFPTLLLDMECESSFKGRDKRSSFPRSKPVAKDQRGASGKGRVQLSLPMNHADAKKRWKKQRWKRKQNLSLSTSGSTESWVNGHSMSQTVPIMSVCWMWRVETGNWWSEGNSPSDTETKPAWRQQQQQQQQQIQQPSSPRSKWLYCSAAPLRVP